MFKQTIDNKPIISKNDGFEIKDLCESIFNFNNRISNNVNVFKVNKSYVMRPDLISQAAYGSTEYMELIMKINGISNPFSINTDDVIIVPNRDEISSIVKPNAAQTTSGDATLRQAYKYIDPAKYPSKSDEVKSFESRDIPKPLLPPNISEENEEQFVIRNNRVYFGENIGKTCLKNGMSVSDYMQRVIKSK